MREVSAQTRHLQFHVTISDVRIGASLNGGLDSRAAANMGAYVVGIDLSRCVERAYRETRFKPQIDLIQET